MVIRVKNATRVKNVPSKYEGFSTSLNWPKNSAYKLTKEEIDMLDKFWEDYYERYVVKGPLDGRFVSIDCQPIIKSIPYEFGNA